MVMGGRREARKPWIHTLVRHVSNLDQQFSHLAQPSSRRRVSTDDDTVDVGSVPGDDQERKTKEVEEQHASIMSALKSKATRQRDLSAAKLRAHGRAVQAVLTSAKQFPEFAEFKEAPQRMNDDIGCAQELMAVVQMLGLYRKAAPKDSPQESRKFALAMEETLGRMRLVPCIGEDVLHCYHNILVGGALNHHFPIRYDLSQDVLERCDPYKEMDEDIRKRYQMDSVTKTSKVALDSAGVHAGPDAKANVYK